MRLIILPPSNSDYRGPLSWIDWVIMVSAVGILAVLSILILSLLVFNFATGFGLI